PLRIEFAGAVYPVTSRGNARQDIYQDEQDRHAFLDNLSRVCERYRWLCHAYCLMSNHCHLLVETQSPTLSKGMKYLNGRYTQYYNRRHNRVGHLFQGRFKGILVEKDAYLLELARYIVLNPVRVGMTRSAKDWPWSSYRATAGFVDAPPYLVTDWILAGFGDRKQAAQQAYRRFVSEGKGQPSPWEALKNQIYLGSDQFVECMQRQLDPKQSLDDIPKSQKQAPVKPLEYYRQTYGERDRAMAEAYRSGHYTLKRVGAHFGVSYATVSRAARKYGV
ncbi:MAG: transposase, partial [Pseudomonadota bacterium]